MKVFCLGVIAGGALMCASPGVAGAATQSHTGGASIWQVDSQVQQPSQGGGIINERSTGNEPFWVPGHQVDRHTAHQGRRKIRSNNSHSKAPRRTTSGRRFSVWNPIPPCKGKT